MSHTPEPWEWSEHHFNAPPYEGILDNECGIYPPDGECGPVALVGGKEDARRIVACVNACRGIKTESLEMEVLSWITDETGENPLQRERDELLEARRACGERLIEVLKERDELLAGRLIEEPLRRQLDELRDEVEYHRTDAKKWALQALKFDKRQPIETAPKVGAGGTAIDQPPLQKLGARLAELLDEDQFAECEALLLAAGVKPYNDLGNRRDAGPIGGASGSPTS